MIWNPSLEAFDLRCLICLSPETPEPRLLSRRNLDDLESKLGGFRLEVFDLSLTVLGLVELRSSVHVFHSVAEHAVDQTCQLSGHRLDRHGRIQSASQAAELSSEIGL